MKWTWRDVDAIACDLVEFNPNVDPLTMSLPDIKTMVLALPSFADDPASVDDRTLEAIQSAWYDEFED